MLIRNFILIFTLTALLYVSKAFADLGSTRNEESPGGSWDSAPDGEGMDLSLKVRPEDILAPQAEYHYSSFGKSDPFVPQFPTVEVIEAPTQTKYEIPITNSLQVPISSLKVAGIWKLDSGERRALIIVSGGRGFGSAEEGVIAKASDPIGEAGKILEITDRGVIARQYRLDSEGIRTFDDKILWLGDPQKSSKQSYVIEPGRGPILVTEPDGGPTTVLPNAPVPAAKSSESKGANDAMIPAKDGGIAIPDSPQGAIKE